MEEWLAQKLARPRFYIFGEHCVSERYEQRHRPYGNFAEIEIAVKPAELFAFQSLPEWTGAPTGLEQAVLEGILDELLSARLVRGLPGASFTLKRAMWHPNVSKSGDFYAASRNATHKLLHMAVLETR